MTATHVVTITATTTTEYNELLKRGNAWLAKSPGIVASVVGNVTTKQVVITAKPEAFVFDQPTWMP